MSEAEVKVVLSLVEKTCFDLTMDPTAVSVPLPVKRLSPGMTGRVALVEISQSKEGQEEVWEERKAGISAQIDAILYGEEENCLQQPILLSFAPSNKSSGDGDEGSAYINQLLSLLEEQMVDYGLADPLETNHKTSQPKLWGDSTFIPTIRYEVDGALVAADGAGTEEVWDTSSFLVFDNLLVEEDSNLRERLLDVVLGRTTGDSTQRWDDTTHGPDPSRWTAGGLIDLPESADVSVGLNIPKSFGLTQEALYDICRDDPPPSAIVEVEQLLTQLLTEFTVTRLPEAVLGAGVSPLTANAPCYGQKFDYHIDGDPFFAPPSPWTDIFGRYANRSRGKPRFMTCLIYLNDEWNVKEWGAPTRCLDVATDSPVDISPLPGRVVLMDQDITHTVVSPSKAAGKRPRYSLVWKLILHPKQHNQDMRQLEGRHQGWPEPVFVGSAEQNETKP